MSTMPMLHGAVAALLMAVAPLGATELRPLPPAQATNPALAELGRHLFFESRLSGDGSRSCATCHVPEKGFSDGDALARGYNRTGHFRNTPGLAGLRLKTTLTWDGRYRSDQLPELVIEMLTSPVTMNADPGIVAERVRQVPGLMRLWHAAFGDRAPPTIAGIAQALATWTTMHDGGDTAVDAALRGEASSLRPLAAEGLRLFTGKAGCVRCHHGAALTDGAMHRLGVPENPEVLRDPERTASLLHHHAIHGSADPMSERTDSGLHALTRRASDRGRFATPSLRGVARTAPYMHNGVLADLPAVVDFYDRGGGRASGLPPLGLSRRERDALVAFLEALSPPTGVVARPAAFDYATRAGAGR